MTNFTRRCCSLFIILGPLGSAHTANAQFFKKPRNFLISDGFNNGTLNFKDNVASGFGTQFSMNLITIHNLSFSVGTHAKYGIENRDGLGYPALGSELVVGGLTGQGFPLPNSYAG